MITSNNSQYDGKSKVPRYIISTS